MNGSIKIINMNKIEIVNDDYLPGNDVKPPIKIGEQHFVLREHVCKCGEIHLDIGLKSEYNFITCYKCREDLPESENIHWINQCRTKSISI